MAKSEISWRRQTEAGDRLDVYARRVGTRWLFYVRTRRRYQQWAAVAEPPLEDWLELLDGVERRIRRRLLRPEEADRVRQAISERFPGAEVS